MDHFTITGYSTALYATWYFIDELGILLDAGDGVSSALTQKSGRIRHAFITHADRDHLTGLLQLNQLNARPGLPKIYYPKDCQSFEALRLFAVQFDRQVARTEWKGIDAGEGIPLNKEWTVVPVGNGHISTAGPLTKSLSYFLCRVKHKLKPQYLGLPGTEIVALREQLGEDALKDTVTEPVLAYSGDSPVEDLHRYDNVRILIHEATFLSRADVEGSRERVNKHSTLEEVMAMVAHLKLEALILGHFSIRYSHQEVRDAVIRHCRQYQINYPVHVVFPGQVAADILRAEPVWRGVQR